MKIRESNQVIDIGQFGGRYTAVGFRSARVAAREGRSATAASGESHIQYDRIKLIAQSREFKRDNPIYTGMIARAVGYIVGSGFKLQAQADKDLNSQIERDWRKFWRKPEIRNILSGRQCEQMICEELLTTGDTGVLKTTKRKIQLFESEQIAGKNGWADDGIDKNSYGTPTSFSVGGYAKGGSIDKRTIRNFTPDQFLFLTRPDRPSSIRGVPPCQASFPMLHRINDVCDSEAIAWQLLARMAVSITQQQGKELGFVGSKADPNKTSEQDKTNARLTELDYALIFHGQPGEEIKGIERNVPGKNFSESLVMFLRLLGLPLGLPLEIILLDWTKSNYSQSRAVLEQAFASFLNWQFMIADFFLSPIYEWWMRGEIAAGKYKETDTIFDHDWIKPTFPWIDQLKEALAWGEKLDRGLTLHSTALKSLGIERDDVMPAREAEIKDAIKRAQRLKEETGEDVPWQIFAGLQTPNQTPSAGKTANDAEEAAETNKPVKKDNKNKKDDKDADE